MSQKLLSNLKLNLDRINDRSKDTLNAFDKNKLNLVKAELFYLRLYLNEADKAVKELDDKNLIKMLK